MTHGGPGATMGEHHHMTLWAQAVVIALGAWLFGSPVTLAYESGAMRSNDMVTGVVILLLGGLAFTRRGAWAAWASAALGFWLLLAPIVFWAPDPAAYTNDTVIGALLIVFAVLIPHGMPMTGPDVPPGWSYNPSTALQRAPIITLAFGSFLIARYLAAFQLGHVGDAWDPFFGDGTVRVLTSEISRAWPISDAGLGAVSYLLEVLMGFMGDRRRWRTMPWMVLFFGVLVIPLGITSIVLVILQPVAVGAWCTGCLLTAGAMLAMIPPALDEVVAMLAFMIAARHAGQPLWRTFWLGGDWPGSVEQERATPFAWSRPWSMFTRWLAGVWHLLTAALIGGWLMFAPAALGATGVAADSDHLVGALVVTFAIIATAEVGRPIRWINVLLGGWLLAAPWILSGFSASARWSDLGSGLAVILLSLPRGALRGRYGGFTRYLR